jgi:hypothetical protein
MSYVFIGSDKCCKLIPLSINDSMDLRRRKTVSMEPVECRRCGMVEMLDVGALMSLTFDGMNARTAPSATLVVTMRDTGARTGRLVITKFDSQVTGKLGFKFPFHL